ncbi:MAG TPA: hypothetical protein VNO83_19860 [Pseudonocardia sp.]|nr:hypothetical protein [Pseudonocardia sp.]
MLSSAALGAGPPSAQEGVSLQADALAEPAPPPASALTRAMVQALRAMRLSCVVFAPTATQDAAAIVAAFTTQTWARISSAFHLAGRWFIPGVGGGSVQQRGRRP